MHVKKRWGVVGLSLAAGAFGALGMLGGCQSDSDDGDGSAGSGNASSGNPGSGGTGAVGGSSASNGGAGGATSTGTQASSGGSAGDCDAPERTIADVTTNTVGPDVELTLKGVVAMSHKFLVYGGDTQCLWGVFISAPNLTETEANSGILVISYGTEPTTDSEGNIYCPKLGEEPTGGSIPDDVKPGDVLDVWGKSDYYKPSTCGRNEGESQVDQYQIASHKMACPLVKTGQTAPLPTPKTLSAADVAKLGSPTDKAFHDTWGGVKVRIENVVPVPFDKAGGLCPTTTPETDTTCIVNKYGEFIVEDGALTVQSNTYYRGYQKDVNYCHASPVFPATTTTFQYIEGFSKQDYCTWTLEPHDKCADIGPASADCAGASDCPFTGD